MARSGFKMASTTVQIELLAPSLHYFTAWYLTVWNGFAVHFFVLIAFRLCPNGLQAGRQTAAKRRTGCHSAGQSNGQLANRAVDSQSANRSPLHKTIKPNGRSGNHQTRSANRAIRRFNRPMGQNSCNRRNRTIGQSGATVQSGNQGKWPTQDITNTYKNIATFRHPGSHW